jgi:hypothetical protein
VRIHAGQRAAQPFAQPRFDVREPHPLLCSAFRAIVQSAASQLLRRSH